MLGVVAVFLLKVSEQLALEIEMLHTYSKQNTFHGASLLRDGEDRHRLLGR
jgi:hypothetical protein